MSDVYINHDDGQEAYFLNSRQAAQDENLSDSATAALTYLLSKPKDWEVKNYDLRRRFKWGRDKATNTIKELVENGYAKRTRTREQSKWVYKTYISSRPTFNPNETNVYLGIGKSDTSFSDIPKSDTSKHVDIQNTDLQITDIQNIEEKSPTSLHDLNPKKRRHGVNVLPLAMTSEQNVAYNILQLACGQLGFEIKCDLTESKHIGYLGTLYKCLPLTKEGDFFKKIDNELAVKQITAFAIDYWQNERKEANRPTVGQVATFWSDFLKWQEKPPRTYHLLAPLIKAYATDRPRGVEMMHSEAYSAVKDKMKRHNIPRVSSLAYFIGKEEEWEKLK